MFNEQTILVVQIWIQNMDTDTKLEIQKMDIVIVTKFEIEDTYGMHMYSHKFIRIYPILILVHTYSRGIQIWDLGWICQLNSFHKGLLQ